MRLFISWSGDRSKYVAEVLRDWIPNVIQSVRPFVSSQDIGKGSRGEIVLAEELENADYGVICLTPENLQKPWILFEAGALSKNKNAVVATLLIDLRSTEVKGPLAQFQYSRCKKKEHVRGLVKSINSCQQKTIRLSEKRVEAAFDQWWPVCKDKLDSIPSNEEELPPKRESDDILSEVLGIVRDLDRRQSVVRDRGLDTPARSVSRNFVTLENYVSSLNEPEVHFMIKDIEAGFISSWTLNRLLRDETFLRRYGVIVDNGAHFVWGVDVDLIENELRKRVTG